MNRILLVIMFALLFECYAKSVMEIPLPPLAVAGKVDRSGHSWRQSGRISGSVAKVHGDFSAAMSSGGWTLLKTINLGNGPARSELILWKKGKTRVLLMIWEKETGMCGFSWGIE